MKKFLLITLLLGLAVFAFTACRRETTEEPPEVITPGPADPTPPGPGPADPTPPSDVGPGRADVLIVGYNVPSTGDFISGFSNSAYDITIRHLLGTSATGGLAAATVVTNAAGLIYVNPTVVASHTVVEHANGDKTHTFAINRGLVWSDGVEITAVDYVATMLVVASGWWVTEIGAIQADGAGMEFVGYGAFNAGDTDTFAGIQLIDSHTFSITVSNEHLPYFYETAMVGITPWPAHVLIPGIDIISDANGARFSANPLEAARNFAETYRWAPDPVSGPYTFVSFVDNIVTLRRNPLFNGDSQGRHPTIEWIQQIEVSTETDIDQLFAGEVDLLPDYLEADKIARVVAHPDFNTHEYLRFGYGVIQFQHYGNDHLPINDVNVRRAFTHVVDRQAVLDEVLEGRGSLIDTMASPGQWMWQARGAEALSLMRPYAVNVEMAHYFLDQTIWVFEADGRTPFNPALANAEGTYLRHNAAGEVLWIRNAAASPAIGAAIEISTVPIAAMAGIRFTSEDADWGGVILPSVNAPHTLSVEERVFSTFSMGAGFGAIFDPYWTWHSDWVNSAPRMGWSDPVMDDAMVRMRESEPGDLESFLDGWLDFVVRFNYMVPELPLYNNMWMDFYNPRLGGMAAVTDLAAWSAVITQLYWR